MIQPTHPAHIDPIPTDPLEADLDSILLQCSNIFEQDFDFKQDFDVEQPSAKRPRQDSGRKFALPKS